MTEARVPRLPVDEAKAAADEAGVPDYMAELAIFQVLLNHPRLACAVNDLLAIMLWHPPQRTAFESRRLRSPFPFPWVTSFSPSNESISAVVRTAFTNASQRVDARTSRASRRSVDFPRIFKSHSNGSPLITQSRCAHCQSCEWESHSGSSWKSLEPG